MKKMGKVVAGVVSLVAAAMVFSGCGTSQASETATEKETVTLWAGGSDNVKVGMDKIVDALVLLQSFKINNQHSVLTAF